MSKMSDTRSRTQYITLKLVSLDSVPSNCPIQCLRIGLRDIISCFYHQMLFLEVILLSTLSKMSNYLVKPQNFAWDSILLDSAPLNYVKKSGSNALLKIALTSSFLYFPLVYSLTVFTLCLLQYGLNTCQSSRLLILIICLLCVFLIHVFYAVSNPGWLESHVFN